MQRPAAGLVVALVLASAAWGAQSFDIARPGYDYVFPRDHGAHDGYKTEWWYYTGHLFTRQGREFGFELTFFRFATVGPTHEPHKSRWFADQLYLAHFALTEVSRGTFRYAERLNRAGLGTAGAETGRLHVWNDSWQAAGDGSTVRLDAAEGADAIHLELAADKPPVIHGERGISKKGPGESNASHYYSLTHLPLRGTVTAAGDTADVTGVAWMDHEFGSSQLSPDQVGWDWIALQLDDRTEVMLYQMRHRDGSSDAYGSGTLVDAAGRSTPLLRSDFHLESTGRWKSPHSGASYPMGWKVDIPSAQLQVELQPLLSDQELLTNSSTGVTYWEGAVKVSGTRGGRPLTGRGYVEMTGYAGKVDI